MIIGAFFYLEKEKIMKKDCQKEFMKIFNQLAYKYNRYDVWRDFVTTFACSISNSLDKCHYEEREKRYLKIIGSMKKQSKIYFRNLLLELS